MKTKEFKKLKNFLFSINENYETACKKLDMSISSFSNKINGRASWDYRDLLKIKDTYNLTSDELVSIFFDNEVTKVQQDVVKE